MSHTVAIRTEIKDAEAVAAACRRLGLAQPTHRRVNLFSSTVEGLAIELPHWKYPVVCDLKSGQVNFDIYGGAWGDQAQLDKLLQAYAVEKTRIEARKKGHTVTEQALPNGEIKLTIQVQGGAA